MAQSNNTQEIQSQLKAHINTINQAIQSTTRLRSCVSSTFKLSAQELSNLDLNHENEASIKNHSNSHTNSHANSYPNTNNPDFTKTSHNSQNVDNLEKSSTRQRSSSSNDSDSIDAKEIYFRKIKEKLIQVQAEYQELEKTADTLMAKRNNQPNIENVQFGSAFYQEPSAIHSLLGVIENTTSIDLLAHLSLDTSHDSQQLYREILHAYQWNTKLRENSHWAFSCAQQNSTKRWSGASNHISGRRRPFRQLGTPGNHTFKSQDIYEHMKKLVTHLSTIFAGLCDAKLHSVNQIIPVDKSNSRILEVTVQNTMRVFLVLRGYLVETIVVRGLDESRYLENGDVDLQTTTRYQVFKKVNNNATAAMQYYVFPTGSFDINLKTLLAWLRSYRNLFTEKCSKCSQFFDKDGVMPTWRDFKALTAQHDGCRNQY